MPEVPIYEGHHNDGPFNRSAAINRASRFADADGRWDVAVIIDSDVFLPTPHVRDAIASATAGKVTWAHRRWRNIAAEHLKRLLADPDTFGPVPAESRDMDLLVDKTTPISWSCCVAVPRSTFDDMGGFDERFRGWGFEDGAWAALVRAMYAWDRIEGDMYHLDHPRSSERIILGESRSTASSDYVRNALLGRRYMVAAIRDHAAGDQQGEEKLSAEMVAIHVRNLMHDDEKFLAMAAQRGMPEREWRTWWPTLEELSQGAKEANAAALRPTVTLVVHTGGADEHWAERSAYLRQSLASLVERVQGPIVQRVIYSDWSEKFRTELDAIVEPLGFYVVGGGNHGYTAGMRRLWQYLAKRARGQFIFATEDDFLYDRDVDLEPMIATLQENPELRQLALLRGPYYPSEVEAGGVLETLKTTHELVNHREFPFVRHRDHWTANPSLFPKSVTDTEWPAGRSSERLFGDALLRDPGASFAYWGTGEPWTRHIGAVRADLPGAAR